MCGAVLWGLLLGVSRGWRCAMGIAAGRRVGGAVLWGLLLGVSRVRRCAGGPCRVGGAVSWKLLTRASSGWRSVFGIADQGVVWVALCHADCWWACRAGGAVSWGLLTRASSGWRRVFGIADQGLAAALVRVGAGVLASQNASF